MTGENGNDRNREAQDTTAGGTSGGTRVARTLERAWGSSDPFFVRVSRFFGVRSKLQGEYRVGYSPSSNLPRVRGEGRAYKPATESL